MGPLVLDIESTRLTSDDIRRISHPLVGMVILFTRNYENRVQLEKLCRAIHDIKPGILIGVDHEGGRVQRFREGFTEIPAMSAYGRAYKDDPEAAARALTAAGFVMASELRTAGVDFTFAPVLDLNWGKSQIIGERSFALDPRVVTRLARAVSHGMLMAGMANCGKHFPGHGFAEADSHLALPVDEREAVRIELADAKPYTWMGIGLASVMTAHVLYPAYDTVPATFSERILKGLLRDTLHFPGFVFSDDLSMKGAGGGTLTQRAQKALAAGCDAVICCNAPEEVDQMLQELVFAPDERWSERAAAVNPKGEFPSYEKLLKSNVYKVSRALMAL